MKHIFNTTMALIEKAAAEAPKTMTIDTGYRNSSVVWPKGDDFWKINKLISKDTFEMTTEDGYPYNAEVKVERIFGKGYLALKIEFVWEDCPQKGDYITFMMHNPECGI